MQLDGGEEVRCYTIARAFVVWCGGASVGEVSQCGGEVAEGPRVSHVVSARARLPGQQRRLGTVAFAGTGKRHVCQW